MALARGPAPWARPALLGIAAVAALLFAWNVADAGLASPYIEATGQEVMPMGGFSGSVPEPTLAQVQQLVESGQLKFFLLEGAGGGLAGGSGGGRAGSAFSTIESSVEQHCRTVPAQDYGGGTSTSTGGGGLGAGGTLYACSTSS